MSESGEDELKPFEGGVELRIQKMCTRCYRNRTYNSRQLCESCGEEEHRHKMAVRNAREIAEAGVTSTQTETLETLKRIEGFLSELVQQGRSRE